MLIVMYVAVIFVTFHAKTYYNDFPLNGWNERPWNGLQMGHQAILNGFQWEKQKTTTKKTWEWLQKLKN